MTKEQANELMCKVADVFSVEREKMFSSAREMYVVRARVSALKIMTDDFYVPAEAAMRWFNKTRQMWAHYLKLHEEFKDQRSWRVLHQEARHQAIKGTFLEERPLGE